MYNPNLSDIGSSLKFPKIKKNHSAASGAASTLDPPMNDMHATKATQAMNATNDSLVAPPHRFSSRLRRAALALAMGAALAVLGGCGRDGAGQGGGGHGAPGGMAGMPPPEVNVITVQPKTVPATFQYTGHTAGSREVEVRARVTGILQKRNFTEGGPVKAGQSLYTIDAVPFQSALARAEADAAAAEASLAQARRNAARLKPLLEAKAVSQKELDDALSAEQVADANLKSARARITDAKLNLEYTRVESPISGIAGRSEVSEGTLVSGPAVLLTTVSQIDPIYVNFGIAETESLRMRSESGAGRLSLPRGGQFTVSVRLADGSNYARTGRMNFSDVRISNVTGASEARAELPNPDGVLRPGQFVQVTLSGATRPNAILVPQRAVLEGPQGKFVYIVNQESKAEPRPVQVGEWLGDAWAINSGLNAGDRVITDGVMRIGPGAPVKVADPASANAVPAKPGAPGAPGAPAKNGAKPEAPKGDAPKGEAKGGEAAKSAPAGK
jgi:membrane fusion protein (multidrug efflux system)